MISTCVEQMLPVKSLPGILTSSPQLLCLLYLIIQHNTFFSQMVQTLYNNGANSIWEHSLLDPSSVMTGKRKANPQDKVQ